MSKKDNIKHSQLMQQKSIERLFKKASNIGVDTSAIKKGQTIKEMIYTEKGNYSQKNANRLERRLKDQISDYRKYKNAYAKLIHKSVNDVRQGMTPNEFSAKYGKLDSVKDIFKTLNRLTPSQMIDRYNQLKNTDLKKTLNNSYIKDVKKSIHTAFGRTLGQSITNTMSDRITNINIAERFSDMFDEYFRNEYGVYQFGNNDDETNENNYFKGQTTAFNDLMERLNQIAPIEQEYTNNDSIMNKRRT